MTAIPKLTLTYDDSTVTVSCVHEIISTLEDVQLTMFPDSPEVTTDNCESYLIDVCFNISDGRTYEKLTLATDVKDVTYGGVNSILMDAVNNDRAFAKKLMAVLAKFIGFEFPIPAGKVKFEHFILFNRFRGYPADFYYGVPYTIGEENILDQSFVDVSETIASGASVGDVYQELELPNKKSIRSTIFNNPTLLFYSKEIQELPFKNHDVLSSILRAPAAVAFLAEVHETPAICDFLSALITFKGEANAWKTIKNHIESLKEITAYWSIAPESVKHSKSSFIGNAHEIQARFGYDWAPTCNTNLPIKYLQNETILEDTIDGYLFVLPCNTFELVRSSKLLNNCLREYWLKAVSKKATIILIRQRREFVAAVEINKDKIRQAKLADNDDIKENSSIGKALTTWAKIHELKLPKFENQQDFQDDNYIGGVGALPF